MDALVYKHEKPLFTIALTFSILAWLLLLVGTLGMALLYAPFVLVMYLFAQSALIAYIQGTAVKITPRQYPDLYERLRACCERLRIATIPDCYLLNGEGGFNAFATRFLGRNFVVLFSDVVDAMEARPGGINFYLGHELGHIQRQHLVWQPLLMPASILPLLGAAYHRAREATCDNYGAACCDAPEDALAGLTAIAAGAKRWRDLSAEDYLAQANETGGFWMSFHELVADYPWLVKRAARVAGFSAGTPVRLPARHPLAYLFALFIPRTLAGAAGGGILGLLMIVMVILVVAAIAIPSLMRSRIAANESMAVGDMRTIVAAEATYQAQNGHYTTLPCLATPTSCRPDYSGPGFVDARLAFTDIKSGYRRTFTAGPPVATSLGYLSADQALQDFAYLAVPVQAGRSGRRAFCTDASGVLYYTSGGEEPTVSDGRCDSSLPVLGY